MSNVISLPVYLKVSTVDGDAYMSAKAFAHAMLSGYVMSRFYTRSVVPRGAYFYDYDETSDTYTTKRRER